MGRNCRVLFRIGMVNKIITTDLIIDFHIRTYLLKLGTMVCLLT